MSSKLEVEKQLMYSYLLTVRVIMSIWLAQMMSECRKNLILRI